MASIATKVGIGPDSLEFYTCSQRSEPNQQWWELLGEESMKKDEIWDWNGDSEEAATTSTT